MKRVLLLTGLLLVSGSTLMAQTGGVARVAVKVPRDARLFVDDVFCPLPGEWRIFDTPPIEADRKFGYTLTVEINHEGRPVRVKKQIVVQANRTTEVDFGTRAAIIAAAQKADGKEPPPLPGQKLPDAPKGFPPMQAKASVKDGKITLELVSFKPVSVDVTVEYVEGGVKKTAIKKETKIVAELTKQELPLKDVKAVDTDNKPIPADKLAEMLATQQVVLFSHAAEVDPFYLSTTKKGTVILLMPPRQPPPAPPGGPKAQPTDPPRRSPTPIPPQASVRQMVVMQPTKGEIRPTGVAPDLVEASLVGTVLEITRNVTTYEAVVKEVEVVGGDGKVRREKVTGYVPVLKTFKMQIDPKKALLSTAGGKDVSVDDVKRLLAKPGLILLGNDFQPVDKFYLQLFEENTLVVVTPPVPTVVPAPAPDEAPKREDRP